MNIADRLTPVEVELEKRKWFKVAAGLVLAAAIAAYVASYCL